jgi:bifunctional DNA primase/polymerase-like protein/primase-like protein
LEKLLGGEKRPRTPTVKTGGGGLHIFFQLPSDIEAKNRISILSGLDIKADGGFVVTSPSLHESGERYEWLPGLAPWEVELAPIPRWLSNLLSKPKRRKVMGRAVGSKPIPEGQRHDSLLRMAGALRRQGATPEDIEAVLLAVNDRRCAPPLPAEEVSRIAESAEDWEPGSSCRYAQRPSGLFLIKPTRDGIQEVKVANFQARIVGDLIEDDGIEKKRSYAIEAVSADDHRRRFVVSAQQFESMRWPAEHLGPTAVVSAGLGLRDHARVAIQELSGSDIERQIVFAHSGWRKYKGERLYLHRAGAIGSDGARSDIKVQLPDCLSSLELPDPPAGLILRAAVRKSLEVLNIAPHAVTHPIYAAVWRATQGPCDFSLAVTGPTGVGKTVVAALAQQHYGAGFDARRLPGSWSSTANANEGLAFFAKDMLLVIDDFAPSGTRGDLARYHKDADRILRAQGNSSGRLRMKQDASLRASRVPRGLILSTGEDVPRGQSLRARTFVIEISPDSLDWRLVTECQKTANSGTYAQALSGFVCWFAHRYERIQERWPERLAKLREEASGSDQHRRTPGIVANLQLGMNHFLGLRWIVEHFLKEKHGNCRKTRGKRWGPPHEHNIAIRNLRIR